MRVSEGSGAHLPGKPALTDTGQAPLGALVPGTAPFPPKLLGFMSIPEGEHLGTCTPDAHSMVGFGAVPSTAGLGLPCLLHPSPAQWEATRLLPELGCSPFLP